MCLKATFCLPAFFRHTQMLLNLNKECSCHTPEQNTTGLRPQGAFSGSSTFVLIMNDMTCLHKAFALIMLPMFAPCHMSPSHFV
jgi:hypothetical protein